MIATAWLLAIAIAAVGSAQGQTSIRFSLDGRLEGPAALFVLAQDKGYFREQGLEVTVDEAASAIEPITRVAGGNYDMGFADINALIRHRDQTLQPLSRRCSWSTTSRLMQ